jgi:hypothetical protein
LALASALGGLGASLELRLYRRPRHAFANENDPVGIFDGSAAALV